MILATAEEGKINELFCFSCNSFHLIDSVEEECSKCGSVLVVVAGMGTLDGVTMKEENLERSTKYEDF